MRVLTCVLFASAIVAVSSESLRENVPSSQPLLFAASLGSIFRSVGGDIKHWLSRDSSSSVTATPTQMPTQKTDDKISAAQKESALADSAKQTSDDALQKLQQVWKALSDEWNSAAKDDNAAPLKEKLDSAAASLEKGQKDWETASSKWGEAKAAFKRMKSLWEKTPGGLAAKISAVAKTADSDTLISDAKAVADKLKNAVDRVWLAALVRFRKALAANQDDPSNAAKKEEVVSAQKALTAAEAKKKSQDAVWEKDLAEWRQKIADLRMPQTPAACGATISEKRNIDEPMRVAHVRWVRAYRALGRAKDADSRRSDSSTKRELAKAQRDFDSACAALGRDVDSWDSKTSAWCEKGMYCLSSTLPPVEVAADVPPPAVSAPPPIAL